MKSVDIMLFAVCIVALAASAIGTASAAIVPFNGTDYSWLHDGPEGDWITQIEDTVDVRAGDSMQFQNRWYNSYASTADIRISYGGGQPYVCLGADEYVYYGLNYGNYYPSGTESVPFYSTVSNCSEEPNHLVVNHQYVYNGLMYGCDGPGFKWTMLFRKGSGENVTKDPAETPEEQVDSTPVTTPSATVTPGATGQSTPVPGPGFDTMLFLTGVVTMAYLYRRYLRK
jgi:hypothetical protein